MTYHDAHRSFPCGLIRAIQYGSGYDCASAGSWHISIFPFIEMMAQYSQYSEAVYYYYNVDPYNNFAVLSPRYNAFTCPSDIKSVFNWSFAYGGVFEKHNYLGCNGNTGIYHGGGPIMTGWVKEIPEGSGFVRHRGALFRTSPYPGSADLYPLGDGDGVGAWGLYNSISSVQDGTSNTVGVSESIQDPDGSGIRGLIWFCSNSTFSAFRQPNTNEPDNVYNGLTGDSIRHPGTDELNVGTRQTAIVISARSNHTGGVNAGLIDGSVQFISNTVNIQTWRAYSTTQGGESASAL